MSDKLSAKQKMFIDQYLVDYNATQAAIRAGYSEKTARAVGHENLTKPDIKKAIQERQEELLKEIRENQYRTVKQLQALVHFDIRNLYDDKGNLKPIAELDEDTASALAGVDVVRGTTRVRDDGEVFEETIKVKVLDRIAALRLMLQVQGALNPDISINNLVFGVKMPDEANPIPA